MKHIIYSMTLLMLAIFFACSHGEEAPSVPGVDSSANKTDSAELKTTDVFKYGGITDDDKRQALVTFAPFDSLRKLSEIFIHIKDSLEMLRETQELKDPRDSLVFLPYEAAAYNAIQEYKKLMESGRALTYRLPGLLDLNRYMDPADSSEKILPVAGKSGFLSHGKFFFLGGAPFIYTVRTENNSIFTDKNGQPEMRYSSSVSENGDFIMNGICRALIAPTTITFGPPLRSYDQGPQDVKGIGTLIHQFNARIPIFFLTGNGVVPGSLIAVTLKIVPENLGCESDQPLIEFACSEKLDEKNILGIYIPFEPGKINSFTVTRTSSSLWTGDLNADGVADLACLSKPFTGMADDTLYECIWFVNINGSWKIIDWAQDLDCT